MKLTPLAKILLGSLGGLLLLIIIWSMIQPTSPKPCDNPPCNTDTCVNPPCKDSVLPPPCVKPPCNEGGDTVVPSDTTKRNRFQYIPTDPITATKLKGIVQLGATGFDSFIIEMDKDKNWRLKDAKFGKSFIFDSLASDLGIKRGLNEYIETMLSLGVNKRNIHFIVSSGAQLKPKILNPIEELLREKNYVIQNVTAEDEGKHALRASQPLSFADNSFVVDIGSGTTKIAWKEGQNVKAESSKYGAKYYTNKTNDEDVYKDIYTKAQKVPNKQRKQCFIIGGIPFEISQTVNKTKDRYIVIPLPNDVKFKEEGAKQKCGKKIYAAIAEATKCDYFVFDSHAQFGIGYLLGLPY